MLGSNKEDDSAQRSWFKFNFRNLRFQPFKRGISQPSCSSSHWGKKEWMYKRCWLFLFFSSSITRFLFRDYIIRSLSFSFSIHYTTHGKVMLYSQSIMPLPSTTRINSSKSWIHDSSSKFVIFSLKNLSTPLSTFKKKFPTTYSVTINWKRNERYWWIKSEVKIIG